MPCIGVKPGYSATLRRILLASAIFILLGVFQVLILSLPFRIYAWRLTKIWPKVSDAKLQNITAELTPRQLGYARLIGRMVTTISCATPWPNKCLVQAVLTKFLLRQFKIANTLVIGVSFDAAGKFKAHAWVTVQATVPAASLSRATSKNLALPQLFTIVGGASSNQEFKVSKTFRDYYAAR